MPLASHLVHVFDYCASTGQVSGQLSGQETGNTALSGQATGSKSEILTPWFLKFNIIPVIIPQKCFKNYNGK